MHLIIIVITLAAAFCLRSYGTALINRSSLTNLSHLKVRASLLLVLFLLPPLLLLTTTLAILWMGTQGIMAEGAGGWLSYWLSLLLWMVAGLTLGKLSFWGWQTVQHIRQQPAFILGDQSARLVDHPDLFSGQIGFWESELVVTQGLLDRLTPTQLQAVLAHEQAHYHYRDTFWFFWLGWLRSLTSWLPQTEFLWQELLLWREIRADAHAGRVVDPLVLAESLLLVVSQPLHYPDLLYGNFSATFSLPVPQHRLDRRIDALLEILQEDHTPEFRLQLWCWSWLVVGFLPLLIIPFHN